MKYCFFKSGLFVAVLAAGLLAGCTEKEEGPGIRTEAVGGTFAVSSTKNVRFASGNLIYSEATGLFRFDTSQYAYSVHRNGANGEWEYFGWSTPATFFGMSTFTSNADYSGDFVDWGTQLGNGTTWRTLSNDEWEYLFNSRSGAVIKVRNKANTADSIVAGGKARYAQVKVCGVKGILLFPDAGDSFVWPSAVSAKPTVYNNLANDTLDGINYTYAEWHSLEAAGCVFLPAAGDRSGTSVDNAGSIGYYWSSTPNGTENARGLGFNGTNVYPQGNQLRYSGFSVRLVQDQN